MATITESKLTSRGRVTVPAAIRERLDLKSGDRLEWRIDAGGTVRVRKIGGTLNELQGLLGSPPRHVTIEQMDAAVRERMRRSSRR